MSTHSSLLSANREKEPRSVIIGVCPIVERTYTHPQGNWVNQLLLKDTAPHQRLLEERISFRNVHLWDRQDSRISSSEDIPEDFRSSPPQLLSECLLLPPQECPSCPHSPTPTYSSSPPSPRGDKSAEETNPRERNDEEKNTEESRTTLDTLPSSC